MVKRGFLVLLVLLAACTAGTVDESPKYDSRLNLISYPSGFEPGNTYEFTWKVSGGNHVSSTSIQLSKDAGFDVFRSSAIQTNGPGVYKGNILVEEGDVYARIHVNLDGEDIYSRVISIG